MLFLQIIQDSLAMLLDGAFAPMPVFFEDMDKAGDGSNPEELSEYIYCQLEVPDLITKSPVCTDTSVLIAISAYKKGAKNREYRAMAEKIDQLIRPVFRFGDRAITVHSANHKIVGGLLSYRFILRFIPDVELPEPSAPPMGELAPIQFTKEKKE